MRKHRKKAKRIHNKIRQRWYWFSDDVQTDKKKNILITITVIVIIIFLASVLIRILN